MSGAAIVPSDPIAFASSIEKNGWGITDRIIDADLVGFLRETVAPYAHVGRGGARNLLENSTIRALAGSDVLRDLACSVLGDVCFAVRALLFDKTADANWKVVWHQDLTIATQERFDVDGYGPWTEKGGVPHVRPPVGILEGMLALRLHLDPCGRENGPVRVIDRTHRLGRLTASAIDEIRSGSRERECLVAEGGILAFRPLILHASSPSTKPEHRRVIHVEFANSELADPLMWRDRVE